MVSRARSLTKEGLHAILQTVTLTARTISLAPGIVSSTPRSAVRREMWTCLLAYNLIRQTMLQSAQGSKHSPRRLSLTAAMQSIAASWLVIVVSDDSVAASLIEAALANLTGHTIGNRPGRIEPHAVKRRPKPHDLLTKPQAQARAELLKQKSP